MFFKLQFQTSVRTSCTLEPQFFTPHFHSEHFKCGERVNDAIMYKTDPAGRRVKRRRRRRRVCEPSCARRGRRRARASAGSSTRLNSSSNHVRVFRSSSIHVRVFRSSSNHIRVFARRKRRFTLRYHTINTRGGGGGGLCTGSDVRGERGLKQTRVKAGFINCEVVQTWVVQTWVVQTWVVQTWVVRGLKEKRVKVA